MTVNARVKKIATLISGSILTLVPEQITRKEHKLIFLHEKRDFLHLSVDIFAHLSPNLIQSMGCFFCGIKMKGAPPERRRDGTIQ